MPPKLAHGMAWLRAFEPHGGEDLAPGGTWFNARKRTLLYPYTVGTIDQALLSAMRVKHHFVRLFGLAGKVVILDEVHSYDVYTGSLLDEMTRRLVELGCTVIVLSATLTGARRAQLLRVDDMPGQRAYPLITSCTEDGVVGSPAAPPPSREYHVRLESWGDIDVARDAADRARKGQCVLCIANTVARAQVWWRAVKAECTEDIEVGLLHSKFPAFRRAEIEKRWIDALGPHGARPGSCVLVATQVVEQSVDIDADALITELAPTDMLLQRMGRVWRHARASRPLDGPEVLIVCGDPSAAACADDVRAAFGATNCLVYAPYVLWRTHRVWADRSVVVLPTDVRDLLEATYAGASVDEPAFAADLLAELEQRRGKLRDLAAAALANVTALPAMEDREGVGTRYSELRMTDVVLAHAVDDTGRGEADIRLADGAELHLCKWQRDIAATAALVSNVVSVATYSLEKALGRVESPSWLAKHFYDPTLVLEIDSATGELSCDGRSTGLAYDAERGLYRKPMSNDSRTPGATPCDGHDDIDFTDKQHYDW